MIETISSVQNPKIKNLVKLRKSSERKKQNLILIEGEAEIRMALEAGIQIRSVFFYEKFISENTVQKLFAQKGSELYKISQSVFDKLAYREESHGLIALATPFYLSLESLELSSEPFILVLENVEKPGNLGAILRTADAAGVDAILVCDTQTDLYNPNVIRASLGCLFTKQVVACSSTEALTFLEKRKIPVYSALLSPKSVPYTQIDFKKACAIAVGTEATGLTEIWQKKSSRNIIIPMYGKIDSMNVSVALAIIAFEAVRQRNAASSSKA